MCDLVLDSFDFPSLNRFQATLLTAMHWRGRARQDLRVDSRIVRLADALLIVIFELLPLALGVFGMVLFQTPTLLVVGYVQGCLAASLFCALFYVVADMSVSFRLSRKANKDHRRYTRALFLTLQHAIDLYKIHPTQLYRNKSQLEHAVKPESKYAKRRWQEDPDDPRAGQRRPSRISADLQQKGRIRVAVVLVGALWTACVISFHGLSRGAPAWEPLILGIMLVFVVSVFSLALRKLFPGTFGTPYVLILVFFVAVGMMLMGGTAARLKATHGEALMMWAEGEPNVTAGLSLPARWPGNSPLAKLPQPYPLCGQAWGAPGARLGALDLANLAWIVYEASPLPRPEQGGLANSSMAYMLNHSFHAQRRPELVSATEYQTLPRWAHFYFPAAGEGGTRVIAIKGTSTALDVFTDTNLYATVQVLQAFQQLIPVLSILPRPVIQWLLWKTHLSTSRRAEEKIWTELELEVAALRRRYPEDHFVLTGHSLGGGIAQIVASRLNIPALVWSAPGAAYSAKRFGIDVQSTKRNVVIVMPDHDVVPRVDLQAGMLQLIECRTITGADASAPQCHSLLKTACEVWRACGDDRDFRETCAPFVARHDLGRLYRFDDDSA